ncbi:zwei Ig domain protein zig-8-like isoform X2 [Portunus trituberculatus]|uniref:zwei Ig domain protein zig-8-like isoform X2 n=1 Tax=Portunus trituberculatus TaxID=210409 RepID=UPI001E1CD648|nr:zwei Ig domain protein zig-8-like isoform X2 [Portunus trituberculatus]
MSLRLTPPAMLSASIMLASLLILLGANSGSAEPNPEPAKGKSKKEGGNWTPPEFDETLPSSVTVMEGETAILPCVVTKLRGRSVSWIRQSDLHVISANQLIFTSDDRFKVRMENETSFELEVRTALTNDSGVYECQVNTRPKLSRPVALTVQASGAIIHGPAEVYIKTGSTLVLTCSAAIHANAITKVDWEHNDTKVTISGPRGGVSIHTEAGGREVREVTSRLSVVRAAPPDAGNYTCHPHAALPATTTVYIVDEQFPAAMHHESRAGPVVSPCSVFLLGAAFLAIR